MMRPASTTRRVPAALCCVIGVLTAAVAAADALPKPRGYVSDFANVLNDGTRRSLESQLEALDRQTSIQLACVTVNGLDGQSIERFATRLFNAWGIGTARRNNGVLVLVAPRDRQMRIEVGAGLERVLTDELAAGLIQTHFVPAFRLGQFDRGIEVGVARIVEILRQEPHPRPLADVPVERTVTPSASATGAATTTTRVLPWPIATGLGLLRAVPQPVQILLLVIGLSVGASKLGTGLRLREIARALTGVLVGVVALAAWWFPFSGWGMPGWLLLGAWTWLVFSAAKDPPRPRPKREPEPAKAVDTAESAQPNADEPWFLRRYTQESSFLDDEDDRPRRRRDRDRFGGFGGGRSSDGGGFGGGSSSGGGASGRW
jgi:uncharacterized membrane protein YgcG